ncbi:hypothetical protein [Hydrocarboniphaga effusa]|uniref:hypothetical protein n=1 Tax=Hydrocarboniphaga effusa TaxID=243629 RepID=UPI0035B48C89
MILQLLNVLIGLTLVYVIFSSIASALFDAVEIIVKRRGKLLARGITEILRRLSDNVDADVERFYEHELINSLFDGNFGKNSRKLPSYIPPLRFARAVLMLAETTLAQDASATGPFVRLRAYAERLVGQRALAPGETLVAAMEAELVDHFNTSMDRVSGWFARYARGVLLVIGLVLAFAANVDTLQIVRSLSMDPLLAERIADSAATYVDRRTDSVDAADDGALDQQIAIINKNREIAESLGLPLGWLEGEFARNFGGGAKADDVIKKVIGLLLTGFALSFGATFWFDLLSKLVDLRASLKPKDEDLKVEKDSAKEAA